MQVLNGSFNKVGNLSLNEQVKASDWLVLLLDVDHAVVELGQSHSQAVFPHCDSQESMQSLLCTLLERKL